MGTFFTADHHFGHANIIQYCHRPFASVDEMDAELIRLWNDTVGAGDTVYHLGDFTLQGIVRFAAIARELNGRLKIIPGSHDHRWLSDFDAGAGDLRTASGHAIDLLPPLVSLEMPDLKKGRYRQVIVLCHYAMRVWDRSAHGSWHLYGHSHGTLPGHGFSFDVGVDCTAFRPLGLEEVARRMAALEGQRTGPGTEG